MTAGLMQEAEYELPLSAFTDFRPNHHAYARPLQLDTRTPIRLNGQDCLNPPNWVRR